MAHDMPALPIIAEQNCKAFFSIDFNSVRPSLPCKIFSPIIFSILTYNNEIWAGDVKSCIIYIHCLTHPTQKLNPGGVWRSRVLLSTFACSERNAQSTDSLCIHREANHSRCKVRNNLTFFPTEFLVVLFYSICV